MNEDLFSHVISAIPLLARFKAIYLFSEEYKEQGNYNIIDDKNK